MDIVLLHKDLRMRDNPALYNASLRGKYIVLYVLDYDYWNNNGYSLRQLNFVDQSLEELNSELEKINSKIYIFQEPLENLIIWIENNFPDSIIHLNHSTDVHEYRQSIFKLKNYFHHRGRIRCYENFGIQTSKIDREIWSKNWFKIMNSRLLDHPSRNKKNVSVSLLPYEKMSKLIKKKLPTHSSFQKGGEKEALKLLQSFLNQRADGYANKMSNPMDSQISCSRLSPHISHGSISLKFVYQTLMKEITKSNFKKDLISFKKRLHWHCHFIQKLQTEPELEFKSMHSMCDDLRHNTDSELIEKWIKGETGFPFLDACLIFLRKNGWINFRMRAMIMSFASYNLWQPWQKTSPLLAEMFVDYEPGIHICQVQMQSGVTGINLPRIYSVIKQSIDQDPDSYFIKSQIKKLNQICPKLIHNCELDSYYREKIIDPVATAKKARETIWSIRSQDSFKKISKEVYLKHGSRFKKNNLKQKRKKNQIKSQA